MRDNRLKYIRLSAIVLLAIAAVPAFNLPALADDSGWASPTFTDSGATLHHPEYAFSSDGISAIADRTGEWAAYRDFAIVIPPNSTVNGIEVSVQGHADNASSRRTVYISLSWDGGLTYTVPADTGDLGTANAYKSVGGATNTWGRPWSLTDFSDEHFRVKLLASTGTDSVYIDHLQARVHFTRDLTRPSVTINQAGAQLDPTGASPVNFTAVFSEPIFEFTSDAISLGGTAHPTTATITGSGTTYNIAVSGMVSSGTVTATIGPNAAHDASGNPSLSSTGSDNTVTFDTSMPTCSITVDAGPNGFISPGNGSVDYGSSPIYTISGNTGYHVADVRVDNVPAGAVTTYQFRTVTVNHTISATFAINEYTISALVPGGHGAASPATQRVAYNSPATVSITADPGYHISAISDNGTPAAITNPYTIQSVDSDHSVAVSFSNVVTVTVSVPEGHGTAGPETSTVTSGSDLAIRLNPDRGYHVARIIDNGAAAPVASPYTIKDIAANHAVAVRFEPDMFAITVAPGPNGTITPGSGDVAYGSSPSYTVRPNAGYYISQVLVDNTSAGSLNTYQFQNISSAHTISATFALSPSGSPGAVNPDSCPVVAQVDVLGTPTIASMTTDGIFCTQCLAMSANKDYQLRITQGTRLSSDEGILPSYIRMKLAEKTFTPPEGQVFLSPIIDISAYRNAKSSTALHVTFEPVAELALRYDTGKLPENASEAYIASYDPSAGWTPLEATAGPAEVSVARGRVRHLAPFAVMARLAQQTRATSDIQLSKLSISPTTASPNQQIKISATLTNKGAAAAEYVAGLAIDGKTTNSQRVQLSPQESKTITFAITTDRTGVHGVALGQLSGQFEVVAAGETGIPWWVWPIVAVVILLGVWRFLRIRKKHSKESPEDY